MHLYSMHHMFCILDDFCRVKLQEIEGVEGSDYVNASYVDVSTSGRPVHIPHHKKFSFFCNVMFPFSLSPSPSRATTIPMPTWLPRGPCPTPLLTSGGWSGSAGWTPSSCSPRLWRLGRYWAWKTSTTFTIVPTIRRLPFPYWSTVTPCCK